MTDDILWLPVSAICVVHFVDLTGIHPHTPGTVNGCCYKFVFKLSLSTLSQESLFLWIVRRLISQRAFLIVKRLMFQAVFASAYMRQLCVCVCVCVCVLSLIHI